MRNQQLQRMQQEEERNVILKKTYLIFIETNSIGLNSEISTNQISIRGKCAKYDVMFETNGCLF
jgi:hypothetical protein